MKFKCIGLSKGICVTWRLFSSYTGLSPMWLLYIEVGKKEKSIWKPQWKGL